MQRKPLTQLLGLLTITMLLLAACGGTATTTPTTAPATGGNAPTAAAPATGGNTTPATIRWRTRPGDAAEQAVYEKLAASANANLKGQNITITYEPGVNDSNYFTKLKTELVAGNAPDIFWIGAVELADFVGTGQILDLKPFIDKDPNFKLADFYDQTIKELSRDGKVYGLPRDISTMVTYFNADLFKAAGLQNPKELAAAGKWNWETFLSSAEKLTDASKQQYGLGFGNWWGPSWGYFVNAAGGSIFNADRTGCALNSPEAIEGTRFARSLFEKQVLPEDDATSEQLFQAGKIGMYFNGRWFMPGVAQNAKFAYDVAEMPMGKVKSTWLFWGPYLINAKTVNPQAAWEAMKQITSSGSMGEVAQMGSNIPARKNQEAVDVFLKSTATNNQAYITGTEYAVAEAPVWAGSWADFSSKVQPLWDDARSGKITPEQFGQRACEETAATFKK